MNYSASKNLKIYNKIAFVFIWIFFGLGCFSITASIVCGIMAGGGIWIDTILPIGISAIVFAGIEWAWWAFTKGFERIVEAAEYSICQVQKNDRQQ